jgi:hypothetical protein
MSINDVLSDFDGDEVAFPRAIYANHTFNGQGTSLYYYINGQDAQGFDAGLKLDFFPDKVRFTNFKKPHPVEKYEPYFDKFIDGCSCSYDDIQKNFKSSSSTTREILNIMAKHWMIPVDKFINTLLLAHYLLWDAEDDGWIDGSWWEGGEFRGTLPCPKR